MFNQIAKAVQHPIKLEALPTRALRSSSNNTGLLALRTTSAAVGLVFDLHEPLQVTSDSFKIRLRYRVWGLDEGGTLNQKMK